MTRPLDQRASSENAAPGDFGESVVNYQMKTLNRES